MGLQPLIRQATGTCPGTFTVTRKWLRLRVACSCGEAVSLPAAAAYAWAMGHRAPGMKEEGT